jgi:hypothetical protein
VTAFLLDPGEETGAVQGSPHNFGRNQAISSAERRVRRPDAGQDARFSTCQLARKHPQAIPLLALIAAGEAWRVNAVCVAKVARAGRPRRRQCRNHWRIRDRLRRRRPRSNHRILRAQQAVARGASLELQSLIQRHRRADHRRDRTLKASCQQTTDISAVAGIGGAAELAVNHDGAQEVARWRNSTVFLRLSHHAAAS